MPSGATFYSGDAFADWRGDPPIGSLTPGGVVRLRLTGDRVAAMRLVKPLFPLRVTARGDGRGTVDSCGGRGR